MSIPKVGPKLALAILSSVSVDELAQAVRPSGYFSDMGAVLDMARRGRVLLVGDGHNRFNPIHGRDLARQQWAFVECHGERIAEC